MNTAETLPTELRMAAPPTIPQARSYMFKQRSEYTNYDMNKSTKIRINIPRLQRTYLSKDSYLRFRVNLDVTGGLANVRTAPLYLDRAGAYAIFDRLEVYDYMGGTLLEQVNNLPALMVLLNDTNNSVDSFNSKLQAVQGYEGSYVGIAPVTNTTEDGGVAESYEVRTSNSGTEIIPPGLNAGATTVSKFASVELAIPLPSFLGNFSTKFVPLHNGFSIDLYLNNINQSFVCYGYNTDNPREPVKPVADLKNIGQLTVDAAWITNMELCAQVMELGNDAENLVLASNGGGPLVIPSTFFRYFTDMIKGYTEPDQSSTFGMDLNLNVVSLRNIRFGMRPTQFQNKLQYPAYGHRIRNYLENFSFQYGSSYLPELAGVATRSAQIPSSKNGYPLYETVSSNKMRGYKQAYVELLKTGSKNHWSNANSPCSINQVEYETDLFYGIKNAQTGTVNTYYTEQFDRALFIEPLNVIPPVSTQAWSLCGKFAGGLDFRLSTKDVISGIDTNGLLVRLNGKFDDDNLVNMVNAILDVWAEHDAFVHVIPGVATTVTF